MGQEFLTFCRLCLSRNIAGWAVSGMVSCSWGSFECSQTYWPCSVALKVPRRWNFSRWRLCCKTISVQDRKTGMSQEAHAHGDSCPCLLHRYYVHCVVPCAGEHWRCYYVYCVITCSGELRGSYIVLTVVDYMGRMDCQFVMWSD